MNGFLYYSESRYFAPMHLSKTPEIVKPIASDLVWDIPTDQKEVFITFDDGPEPSVTPQVLDIMDKFGAKGTFFCVGSNVNKHPELFQEIQDRGHAVGNHTWAHENGWKTSQFSYCRSVIKADSVIQSRLFRPPYGRIKKPQADALKKRFNLIMWDVLSGDWDANRSVEKCLDSVVKNTKPGSIIVFHDSIKAKDRVLNVLPSYLEFLKSKGMTSSVLTDRNTQPRKKQSNDTV